MRSARLSWASGPVGDAVAASTARRIQRFVSDPDSEAIALFAPEARAKASSGDWYGEHAGKWLVAASHAAARTGDDQLSSLVARIADYLVSTQEPEGYLGTYAPDSRARFTHLEASSTRTWDLWVHAWMMLGLLDADRADGAARIGDLMVSQFTGSGRRVIDQGNHAGLSSAVVIEPLARLAGVTGITRYRALAESVAEQVAPMFAADDVSRIGTGKAYQILWVLLGLLELGDRDTAKRLWQNVADDHLNPLGGPWGGIGTHKEVFNAPGFFSPKGMVETCSTATWMELSLRLYESTGERKYIDAYETALLNALLGALDENGSDWIYFSFANGRRNNTYHWACCRASGALALERASDAVVTEHDGRLRLNLHLNADIGWEGGHLRQRWTPLPEMQGEIDSTVPFLLRVPAWSEPIDGAQEGWLPLEAGRHAVTLRARPRLHPFTYTVDHHGQEIVREDYAHVSLGPLVYAHALLDGYKKHESLCLPHLFPTDPLSVAAQGWLGPELELRLPGRSPIELWPYAEAGGRRNGTYRGTWLEVAWQ